MSRERATHDTIALARGGRGTRRHVAVAFLDHGEPVLHTEGHDQIRLSRRLLIPDEPLYCGLEVVP